MKNIDLEISPSLLYRFVSFMIKADGMIGAVVEERTCVHTDDFVHHTNVSFAGNNKGANFWLPADEGLREEIGHIIPNNLDVRIADWLKDVWKEITS